MPDGPNSAEGGTIVAIVLDKRKVDFFCSKCSKQLLLSSGPHSAKGIVTSQEGP